MKSRILIAKYDLANDAVDNITFDIESNNEDENDVGDEKEIDSSREAVMLQDRLSNVDSMSYDVNELLCIHDYVYIKFLNVVTHNRLGRSKALE